MPLCYSRDLFRSPKALLRGPALVMLLLAWALPGCPPGGATSNSNQRNANAGPRGNTISADTTFISLSIAPGVTVTVQNNAVITVNGNTTIDGTLTAPNGRLLIRAMGNVTLNGTLSAVETGTADFSADTPLDQQPAGIYIVAPNGAVTLGPSAVLNTSGNYVITDDESVLSRTPRELADETTNVSGDNLPTLAPLDPENPALDGGNARVATAVVQQGGGGGLPPHVVTGMWPPAGAMVPGDRPVVIVRFNGPRDVIVRDWTFNSPPAPGGMAGGNGRNGQSLNIRNNGGSVRINGTVTLNLADGGPGSDAAAVCASATGGNGGEPGNLRITGSEGIDLTGGMLLINPGRGGAGGNATVTAGPAGAGGCPGMDGGDSTATGGNGGRNMKALFARGNVDGLENVTIGPLSGGAGGTARATACDGGDGTDCCDGGAGGDATATGGRGGDASLNLRGLAVTAGSVNGGDGGTATATAGAGGNGGDCKFDDGGDGGAGGTAMATGGAGGMATAVGGGIPFGGDGGTATSTGGDGGDGGDSGFGLPGNGGAAGGRNSVAGAGGAPGGAAGQTNTNDGLAGLPGGQLTIRLFCFSFVFLAADSMNMIAPGTTQTGPVTPSDSNTLIGMLAVDFVASPGAQYFKGTNPVPHVGLMNGTLGFRTSTLQVEMPANLIGGLRIAPLFANGISETNPLVVQARNAAGEVIDSRSFATVPNNSANPSSPQTLDATFNVNQSIAEFRIVAPLNSFVTILQIYLLDP